jgi:hypothetical protein
VIHSWWMRERLQLLLDGELSEARRVGVEEHLRRCPRCAAMYQGMAEGDRLLMAHNPCPTPITPPAAEALLARALVEARVSRGGPWRGMTILAWGFAALLIIAASGAAAWWRRPDQLAANDRPSPSRFAPQGVEGERASEIQSVADNCRHSRERTAASSRSKGASGPARHDVRRHERKRAPVAAGAATRPEPRRRRPQPSSRRLMATMPPQRLDQLPPPGTGDVTGTKARVWLDKSVVEPEDSRRSRRDEFFDEESCDREAVRLVNAALDGDGSAMLAVSAALDEWPAAAPEDSNSSPVAPRNLQRPDLSVAELPLFGPAVQPEAPVAEALSPRPELLVMVSTSPASSPVTVTVAPAETPGFAQAVACRPDAAGRDTWMQATTRTNANGTQTALVMLGDEAWDW